MIARCMVIGAVCCLSLIIAPGCSKKITKIAEQTPVASKMIETVKARDGSNDLVRQGAPGNHELLGRLLPCEKPARRVEGDITVRMESEIDG